MDRNDLIILIFLLRDRRYHPAWFSPSPFPGDPLHIWRYVMGGIKWGGFGTLEEAQVHAVAMQRALDGLQTKQGTITCKIENVALTRVLDTPVPIEIIAVPPFGPGTSLTLLEVLDLSGQKLITH